MPRAEHASWVLQVFSILGNMAFRQREIANGNADLRIQICRDFVQQQADSPGAHCTADFDCSNVCGGSNWDASFAHECCGNFDVSSVAQAGIYLAFSVRNLACR